MSRGLNNNNPGNIRLSGTYWIGAVSGSDTSFVTFSSLSYGYRAMFVLLKNYISAGYNTISLIINRWAPSSENDTISYINHVVNLTGIAQDTLIDSSNETQMKALVSALSTHENGIAADPTAVAEGWALTGQIQTAKVVTISGAAIILLSGAAYLLYRWFKIN